jgi:hypothetical protein
LTSSGCFAPIVLFVYARLEHTKKTIKALVANQLASSSDLYIYSDAARSNLDKEKVDSVREYIETVKGFNSIKVIERDHNYGLASNVIDGVTEVSELHGRVIVLEDDIVTDPYFLTFMNNALNEYRDNHKVWHISGWSYPIDKEGLQDIFFWRVMNCWGWATWSDRWLSFTKDPDNLIHTWDRKTIKKFNLDGYYNFWSQVVANQHGGLNTWAVFWYATIFSHHGLCLNPVKSLVVNIGLDGSGENCGSLKYNNDVKFGVINNTLNLTIESDLSENVVAVNRIKKYYKNNNNSLLVRVVNKATRALFNTNLIK